MKRILVVDDSRSLRVVIRYMLETLAFAVDEAENGTKALEFLQTNLPDAVLLDVNMPEMDGLECLRTLRGDAKFRSLPVIMCSSRTEAETIVEAMAAGANEYIMKPFTEEILADKLRQVGLQP